MSFSSKYNVYYCPKCMCVFDDKCKVTTNDYMIKGGFFYCQECKNKFQIREYKDITLKQKRKIDKSKITKIITSMKEKGYSIRKIADILRLGKTYVGNIYEGIEINHYIKKVDIENNSHNKIVLDNENIILKNILPRNKEVYVDDLVIMLIKFSCSRSLIHYLLNCDYIYFYGTVVKRRCDVDFKKRKKYLIKDSLNFEKDEKELDDGKNISYHHLDKIQKKYKFPYSKDPLYRLSIFNNTIYLSATYVLPLLLTYKYVTIYGKLVQFDWSNNYRKFNLLHLQYQFTELNLKTTITNYKLVSYLKLYNVYIESKHLNALFEKYKINLELIKEINNCISNLGKSFRYKLPNGHVVRLDIGDEIGRININELCKL